MKKISLQSMITRKFAMIISYALIMVLFVCANTNSCCLVHQPDAPEALKNFSKIQ